MAGIGTKVERAVAVVVGSDFCAVILQQRLHGLVIVDRSVLSFGISSGIACLPAGFGQKRRVYRPTVVERHGVAGLVYDEQRSEFQLVAIFHVTPCACSGIVDASVLQEIHHECAVLPWVELQIGATAGQLPRLVTAVVDGGVEAFPVLIGRVLVALCGEAEAVDGHVVPAHGVGFGRSPVVDEVLQSLAVFVGSAAISPSTIGHGDGGWDVGGCHHLSHDGQLTVLHDIRGNGRYEEIEPGVACGFLGLHRSHQPDAACAVACYRSCDA